MHTWAKLTPRKLLRTKHRPRDGHCCICPFNFLSEQFATRRLHAVAKVVAFLVILADILALLHAGGIQFSQQLPSEFHIRVEAVANPWTRDEIDMIVGKRFFAFQDTIACLSVPWEEVTVGCLLAQVLASLGGKVRFVGNFRATIGQAIFIAMRAWKYRRENRKFRKSGTRLLCFAKLSCSSRAIIRWIKWLAVLSLHEER